MAKQFSDSIVADVFGRSFEPVDVLPSRTSEGSRAQLTVVLDSALYARVWDEVDRRHREQRTSGAHVQYGTSQLVEQAVDEFLASDLPTRELYYAKVTKGDRRVGFRFSEDLRDRMVAECARRIQEGTRRQQASVTSVIAASIEMFLDGNESQDDGFCPPVSQPSDLDEFSVGLVF